MGRPGSAQGSVLFCPFCAESFEGLERCPDHDLALVPWQALPPSRPPPRHDEPVARWSPRHGRGVWLAASALMLLAFALMPLGRVHGDARYGGSMLALALHGAHRLWLVPAGALALFASVLRRRTRASLRAASVALCVLLLVPPLGASWAYAGSRAAVALLAERGGEQLSLVSGAGLYALWLLALAGIAALIALHRGDGAPRGR